jgi:hypothetical protein
MFAAGDTFYGGGEIHPDNHLWVVINDPTQHQGEALFVNITTLKGSFAEPTCILQAGEHPFVHHPSYIRFGGAKTAQVSQLNRAESMNLIKRQPPVSAMLLQRIQQAALISPRLNQTYKALL